MTEDKIATISKRLVCLSVSVEGKENGYELLQWNPRLRSTASALSSLFCVFLLVVCSPLSYSIDTFGDRANVGDKNTVHGFSRRQRTQHLRRRRTKKMKQSFDNVLLKNQRTRTDFANNCMPLILMERLQEDVIAQHTYMAVIG